MNIKEQESIQRMKLLMGYNPKKTFSENYESIISKGLLTEQRTQRGLGSELPPPEEGRPFDFYWVVWLNANPNLIGPGKPYNGLWNKFIKLITQNTYTVLNNVREQALSATFTITNNKTGQQKQYSSYSLGIDGGITSDLMGADRAAFTGPATAMLDSQMYLSRRNNYMKLQGEGKTVKEPPAPAWNVLGDVNIQTTPTNNALTTFGNLVNVKVVLEQLNAFGKSASEIVGAEESEKNKCYFNNKTEGDEFRLWVNTFYPVLAQTKEKNGGLELSLTGEYCNEYIRKAYKYKLPSFYADGAGKTLGELYESYLAQKKFWQDGGFKNLDLTIPTDYLGGNKKLVANGLMTDDQLRKSIEMAKIQNSLYQDKAEENECDFVNPEEGNNFRFYVNTIYPELADKKVLDLAQSGDYCNSYIKKAYRYVLPNTYEYGAGKTLGELYNAYVKFTSNPELMDKYQLEKIDITAQRDSTKLGGVLGMDQEQLNNVINQNKLAQSYQEYQDKELFGNELIIKIFGKEKLEKARKECPYELDQFIQAVLDGQVFDEEQFPGRYYKYGTQIINSKGQLDILRWPKNKPIPCKNEFWEKYGTQLSWGITILSIALSIPTLGTSLTFGMAMGARLFISAALDFGINLTSAHFNKLKGDDEAARLDVVIAILSAAVEIKGISFFLTRGLDDWGEKAVLELFRARNPKNYAEFKQFLDQLKPNEKIAMGNILDNKQVQDKIKNFSNETVKEIGKKLEKEITRSTGLNKFSRSAKTIFENIKFKATIPLLPIADKIHALLYYAIYGSLDIVLPTGKDPNDAMVQEFLKRLEQQYPSMDQESIAMQIKDNPELLAKIAYEIAVEKGEIPDEKEMKQFEKEIDNWMAELDEIMKKIEEYEKTQKSDSTSTEPSDEKIGDLEGEELEKAKEEFVQEFGDEEIRPQ